MICAGSEGLFYRFGQKMDTYTTREYRAGALTRACSQMDELKLTKTRRGVLAVSSHELCVQITTNLATSANTVELR